MTFRNNYKWWTYVCYMCVTCVYICYVCYKLITGYNKVCHSELECHFAMQV